MRIELQSLQGVAVAHSTYVADVRGAFARWFCRDELASVIGSRNIVQMNHSRTTRVGAIRGLHFQRPPHSEMKLIRCLRGAVLDVVVDLRSGSATYLRHHRETLRSGDGKLLVVPEGFAHGFQTLEPDTELLYLHTTAYTPAAEGGFRFDDPAFAIEWPLPATDMSPRDLALSTLSAENPAPFL